MSRRIGSFCGMTALAAAAALMAAGPGRAQELPRRFGGDSAAYLAIPPSSYHHYHFRIYSYYGTALPHLLGTDTGWTEETGYNGTPQDYALWGAANYPYGAPAYAGATAAPARVIVKVPDSAAVWFNGNGTTSTGPVREYESPPLTPGVRYTYEVGASWQENGHTITQTQHVTVSGDSSTEVSFPTAATPLGS